MRQRAHGAREFDPVRLGRAEVASWVAFHQHKRLTGARAFHALAEAGFGLRPGVAWRGAWYLWLANRAWRPYPDNDPEAAREYVARYYELVRRDTDLDFQPVQAAVLELEWWRRHRLRQQEARLGRERVVEALAALWAYVYGVDAAQVETAARGRVLAMELSDEWVLAGARRGDARIGQMRRELVTAYGCLREAVPARG